MKIFITKYALTKGIIERDVEETALGRSVGFVAPDGLNQYVCGAEWHKERIAAVLRAKDMQRNKLASLEKQIAKLRKLEFK